MTRFVQDIYDTYIAMARVSSAKAAPNREDRLRTVVLYDDEGTRLGEVYRNEFDLAVAQCRQMFPAQPGTNLLYFYEGVGGDDPGFYKEPVLAWRDCQYGGLEPVTLQTSVLELYAIELPDGRVIIPEEADYDNAGEYLKAMVARAAEKHAKAAAAAEGAA